MKNITVMKPLLTPHCFLSCILFFASLLSSTTSANGFTNETDRQALLAMKYLIREDPFQVLNSWNESLHFCKWKGIRCSPQHQRVTVLDLSSLKLVGSLSPHIGNLTFLRMINLANNLFYGIIPQQVGDLFRLQYLILANNTIQGQFPSNLSRCAELRSINIGGNKLEGVIPADLGSLSKLFGLYLSSNFLIGKVPSTLGNITALRSLFLANNHLEGSIPSELGRLSQLEEIQLSSNNLSGTIPPQLFNISSVTYFSMVLNKLHGYLPPDLGLTLPKLEFFAVGGNQFSGLIPASLANASRLMQIGVAINAFTGPLPLNFGSLQLLEYVNFGGNPFGTEKGNDFSFLTSLVNCTNLQKVDLYRSELRGELPISIGNLSTKLTSLWLDRNYIFGSIPSGIGNLVNLQDMRLHSNMLTGSIPDSIGRLSKLQELIIYRNRVSGKIPPSIGNMTQLSLLALEENLLEGSIPESLGNCKYLQGIDLRNNLLTGAIPREIFGLSSLTIGLFLTGNHFTGVLPMEVGNLKNLGVLDISENELSGEIPITLGNCLSLEYLLMGGNLLEGEIPSSFEKLKALQFLDLSRNNLSGQIPMYLGESSVISLLNLSFNKFVGEVPNKGIFNNISAVSVLGNPDLCGGISLLQLPACPRNVSRKGQHFTVRVIVPILSAVVFITLVVLCAYIARCRKRRSQGEPSSRSPLENLLPKLSYAEIFRATNGFSSANLIGEGRYGSVYRGNLDGEEDVVAVKVLNLQVQGASKTFLAECEALRTIKHRNLVKIITSCSSIDFKGNDFKALVFEFMPNGSLESWLYSMPPEFQELEARYLTFSRRLDIAIDVASALDYLHHHCHIQVVHCDLKPSNVLLDDDLAAHVCDFGLAKLLLAAADEASHTNTISLGIRGTIGYVAPEYGMGGEISAQGDVYSYGILVLEMFTGKKPTGNMFNNGLSLRKFVNTALPDQVIEIVDPQLRWEENGETNRKHQSSGRGIHEFEKCLAAVLRIGVMCSSELPMERMDISDVLTELNAVKNAFAVVEREME